MIVWILKRQGRLWGINVGLWDGVNPATKDVYDGFCTDQQCWRTPFRTDREEEGVFSPFFPFVLRLGPSGFPIYVEQKRVCEFYKASISFNYYDSKY